MIGKKKKYKEEQQKHPIAPIIDPTIGPDVEDSDVRLKKEWEVTTYFYDVPIPGAVGKKVIPPVVEMFSTYGAAESYCKLLTMHGIIVRGFDANGRHVSEYNHFMPSSIWKSTIKPL